MSKHLEIEYLKPEEIIPYANNSRTHSITQIQQVASSIKEFGFNNPILIDENKVVIAGHGRLEAAQKLNLDTVPTITLIGLSEAQRKAYVIADNKIALNSEWDEELLKIEMERLKELDFDLELIGFDDEQLKKILLEPDFSPADEDEQGALDELDPKWIDCPHCGKEFDMRQAK